MLSNLNLSLLIRGRSQRRSEEECKCDAPWIRETLRDILLIIHTLASHNNIPRVRISLPFSVDERYILQNRISLPYHKTLRNVISLPFNTEICYIVQDRIYLPYSYASLDEIVLDKCVYIKSFSKTPLKCCNISKPFNNVNAIKICEKRLNQAV